MYAKCVLARISPFLPPPTSTMQLVALKEETAAALVRRFDAARSSLAQRVGVQHLSVVSSTGAAAAEEGRTATCEACNEAFWRARGDAALHAARLDELKVLEAAAKEDLWRGQR